MLYPGKTRHTITPLTSYDSWSAGAGGVAYAIQPHREVRPESGLSIYEIHDMKACRITTLFFGGRRREREREGEESIA